MTGHAFIGAQIELDATLFPGMNEQHSLISSKYFRCAPDAPFVRHDLRVWESSAGRDPRLRDAAGKLLLGDALMDDWRARTARGAARVRAYYDVHPSADSALTSTRRRTAGGSVTRDPSRAGRGDEELRGGDAEHIRRLNQWRRGTTGGSSTSARGTISTIRRGCRMGPSGDQRVRQH